MSRMLLMQSILGHMALLEEKYPRKASSAVAKRAKQAVKRSLRMPQPNAAGPALRKAA